MGEFEEKVRAAFDAEFKRAPTRPGLRQRVIAKAVAAPRTRRLGIDAWFTPPRLALVGAAAVVLVVAGIGIKVTTTPSPPITAHRSPAPSVLAFGKLPAPGLHAPLGVQSGGYTPAVLPYFGPANLTWAGQLPKAPASAPVYRFNIPAAADADKFAARLGATLTSAGSGSEPRQYRLPDGSTLTIRFSSQTAGEPTFDISRNGPPSGTQPLGESAARTAANAELARLGLSPTWKFTVSVTTLPPTLATGPLYIVTYQRLVDLGSGVTAGEVDNLGAPSGLQVEIDSSGKADSVSGALRLAEQHASYPLRPPSAAIPDAVTAPPSEPQTFPTPNVSLTQLMLVYTVVTAGQYGYLEPAYLFTGRFHAAATEWEKRVLIPGVSPNNVAS